MNRTRKMNTVESSAEFDSRTGLYLISNRKAYSDQALDIIIAAAIESKRRNAIDRRRAKEARDEKRSVFKELFAPADDEEESA